MTDGRDYRQAIAASSERIAGYAAQRVRTLERIVLLLERAVVALEQLASRSGGGRNGQ